MEPALEQVYPLTLGGRRWRVALTPEGRALLIEQERVTKDGTARFRIVWQSAEGGRPSSESRSHFVCEQALKLHRAASATFREAEARDQALAARHRAWFSAWGKVHKNFADTVEPLTGCGLSREDARKIGERFLRYAETGE